MIKRLEQIILMRLHDGPGTLADHTHHPEQSYAHHTMPSMNHEHSSVLIMLHEYL